MKRVLILVEGQTEEQFVQQMLKPHLLSFSIYTTPVILKTSDASRGRGGVSKYTKVKGDILRLLQDTNATVVTTMLDYYGLPKDFPGKTALVANDPYQRVAFLEGAWAADIQDARFLPFLMLHEFEALLFADIEKLFEVIPGVSTSVKNTLRQLAQQPPELINDGENTHPAQRIEQHISGYSKVLHGVLVVQRVGLARIRERCPHFHEWLSKLETI